MSESERRHAHSCAVTRWWQWRAVPCRGASETINFIDVFLCLVQTTSIMSARRLLNPVYDISSHDESPPDILFGYHYLNEKKLIEIKWVWNRSLTFLRLGSRSQGHWPDTVNQYVCLMSDKSQRGDNRWHLPHYFFSTMNKQRFAPLLISCMRHEYTAPAWTMFVNL